MGNDFFFLNGILLIVDRPTVCTNMHEETWLAHKIMATLWKQKSQQWGNEPSRMKPGYNRLLSWVEEAQTIE